MKSYLFFILFNLLAVQGWAAGAGVSNIMLDIPPQVAGAIEGNVIPNTAVKLPPKAVIVDERGPEAVVVSEKKTTIEPAKIPTINFGKCKIPADYKKIKILGEGVVPKAQALKYVYKNSSGHVQLNCSAKDIVDYYYEEAEKEGVRPDLALCQAIVETGTFSFRGVVYPQQNNFCGLGTTGKGVHGAKFATPQEGVRAHIQHLLAYCKKDKPKNKIIDPRYEMVHKLRLSRGLITNWYGLNGTWAMGANYCEKIMIHYYAMVTGK